jgi:chemotaxis protein histidine kinase CheA
MRDTASVNGRPDACIVCEHTVESAAGEIGFNKIENGEWVCDSCLKLLRSWKSEVDFMVLMSDRLPGKVIDAINAAGPAIEREINSALADADTDFEFETGEGIVQNATTDPDGEPIADE